MIARGARGKPRLWLILVGVAIGLSVGLTVGLPLGVAGSVGVATPAFAEDETFLFDVLRIWSISH
jgi:hypothetical protein